MQKVIVTGATGLIGSHLIVELLKIGEYSITAMVRSKESLSKLKVVLDRHGLPMVEHILVDTSDYLELKEALSQFDIIYHCAAIVTLSNESTEYIVAANVELTHYVVESALASTRKPLLIHLSSVASIGTVQYPEQADETVIFSSITNASPYSRSKFMSENEIRRGIKLGLRGVIVNPSVVLGFTDIDAGGIQFILSMADGGISVYTDGLMAFVDVVDVARILTLLIKRPELWGSRYIISGHNLTYRELITELNDAFGKRPPLVKVPKTLLRLAVPLFVKADQRAHFSANMIDLLTTKIAYDGSLIERSLSIKYMPIAETIARIAQEYNSAKAEKKGKNKF